MAIYYGLIIFVLCINWVINHLKVENKKRKIIILSFLATVLIQGLRAPIVGIDLKQYIMAYKWSNNISWTTPVLGFEIGFRIFIHLLATFNLSERLFIFVISFLCQIPIFYFVYKKSDTPIESLLIYYTFGLFTFTFSGIRQTMAIGIVLMSILTLEKDKNKTSLVLIVIASMIHKSAIICIIMLFMKKNRIKRRGRFLMLGIFALEMIFGKQIVLLASKIYGGSYEIAPTGAYSLFMLYIIVWLCAAIFLEDESHWPMYTNFMLIAAFIQGLGAFQPSIGRIGYYFSFFECLLIPQIIRQATNSTKTKILLRFALIVFCFLFFYINTGNGYLDVSPYILLNE